MSTTTQNLELFKPDLTDVPDITALNDNWDKLDEEVNKKANSQEINSQIEDISDEIDTINQTLITKADLVNGKVPENQLPTMLKPRLIVQCDKGSVVTVTKGSITLTETASGDIVAFDLPEFGVYTVEVATFSKTISVTAVKFYTLDLRRAFSYKQWLKLGEITKTFSSLNAVLADQPTVRILMTKHASVDYLREALIDDTELQDTLLTSSTTHEIDGQSYTENFPLKWIGLRDYAYDTIVAEVDGFEDKWLASEWWELALKDHVPVMTSNTAPYGEVSGIYTNDYWLPYHAFDGDINRAWGCHKQGSKISNIPISYKFTNPIKVLKVKIENYNATSYSDRGVKDYKIQYSDDNTNWYDAISGTALQKEIIVRDVSDYGYHLYWRLLCVNNYDNGSTGDGSYYLAITELQFYGRSLNVSVPVMTSNTEPWGEASASSVREENYPWKAFDDNDTTYWIGNKLTNPNASNSGEIKYRFTSKVCVKNIKFIARLNTATTKIIIKASNDGSTFTELYSGGVNVSGSNALFVSFNNNESYQYYALEVTQKNTYTDTTTSYLPQVGTLQFYGIDYSERSDRTYIYDHGVEVMPIKTNFKSNSLSKKEKDVLHVHQENTISHSFFGPQMFDITDYKLMRVIIDDKVKNRVFTCVGSYDISTYTETNVWGQPNMANLAYKIITVENLKNPFTDVFIDISNVNQNAQLLICDGSDINRTHEETISEWWLE